MEVHFYPNSIKLVTKRCNFNLSLQGDSVLFGVSVGTSTTQRGAPCHVLRLWGWPLVFGVTWT